MLYIISLITVPIHLITIKLFTEGTVDLLLMRWMNLFLLPLCAILLFERNFPHSVHHYPSFTTHYSNLLSHQKSYTTDVFYEIRNTFRAATSLLSAHSPSFEIGSLLCSISQFSTPVNHVSWQTPIECFVRNEVSATCANKQFGDRDHYEKDRNRNKCE